MTDEIKEIFIGEEIEVLFDKKPGFPVGFKWKGKEYRIKKIIDFQRKLDFRKPWWRRHHRDYYIVETETGEVFEFYFHRGVGKSYWVLYKKLL